MTMAKDEGGGMEEWKKGGVGGEMYCCNGGRQRWTFLTLVLVVRLFVISCFKMRTLKKKRILNGCRKTKARCPKRAIKLFGT